LTTNDYAGSSRDKPTTFMLCLSFSLLLLSLGLWALRVPSAHAIASLHPSAQPQFPTMILTKTVGTDPTACAATSEIRVVPGIPVYECLTLNYYDPALPPPADLLILPPFILPLAAGESANLGSFPFTATVSTNTTGTVLYHTEVGISLAVTATARVNVIERQLVQTYYLPLIYALPVQPAPVFSARMDVTVSKSELHIGETTDPFTYTLRAEESGTVAFAPQAYRERYCNDFWAWHYVWGTSPAVTVR